MLDEKGFFYSYSRSVKKLNQKNQILNMRLEAKMNIKNVDSNFFIGLKRMKRRKGFIDLKVLILIIVLILILLMVLF